MTSEVNLEGNREQRGSWKPVGKQGLLQSNTLKLARLGLQVRFPPVSAVPDLFTALPAKLSHIADIAC